MMSRKCILFFVLLCLGAPGVRAQATTAQSKGPAQSDQQISEFSLSGYGEKGKKTWDLFGQSADIFENTVKLQNITGNMFGEKENIKLTADKGDFDKNDGRVHLEENVEITTTSGAKLTTDTLDWDRKNQLVTTKDQVNIEKENMVSTATGATGHPNLNTMTLEKDVTVTMNPDVKALAAQKNEIIITCDGPLEIDYQANVARFNNNVKADKKDSVIYCDIMEMYFGKNDSKPEPASEQKVTAEQAFMGTKIDKLVCRGNVRIVRGENVSYCEEAVYTALDQKITLTGRPKLVIYSTEDFKSSFGN